MSNYQVIGQLTAKQLEKLRLRFWEKVDKSADCWEWKAYATPNGYGSIIINGVHRPAHRVAYELVIGPIPRGKELMHSCDNRLCVNPSHLSPGTRSDNIQDMMRKGRSGVHYLKGSRNYNAKLTTKQVSEIRSRYVKSEYGCKKLAKEYGVHFATIHLIVTGKSWIT